MDNEGLNEDLNGLNVILNKDIIMIDNTIQVVYTDLLEYYNENKEDVPEYIAKELSKIIHLLEVTEDYTEAFKRLNNLRMELTP